MAVILPTIQSPLDLQNLTRSQLHELAIEIREELCRLADKRSVHFASNLGVVELCIALHTTFDFTRDRLIWDTGHQVYPHKLLTGRYHRFDSIRSLGGLMGYPNPAESEYDLFMTGHAGCSVGAALGLTCGDDLLEGGEKRHSVAVIGDGALGSGVVFESLCHAGWLKKNITVILNDNKMSICPRVGGLGRYLDSMRLNRVYLRIKNETHRLVHKMPWLGASLEKMLGQFKSAIKAGLLGGMLFEELGFRYIGPIDGHNISQLRRYLKMVRDYHEPVLFHIFTEKGRGYQPAVQDPTTYHAPSPEIKKNGNGNGNGNGHKADYDNKSGAETSSQNTSRQTIIAMPQDTIDCEVNVPFSYTEWARDSIFRLMCDDKRVCVITAAMCQGNMLELIRERFPGRFFDVGICESHAVVFAAGLAKAGMRPIIDIYSTFMQRGYDHIFQEISLQNLPVTLMLDRAGIAGADGPTHHGVFDLAYLRPFPNLTVMAPGCAGDMLPMLQFAIRQNSPVAIRYAKAAAPTIMRNYQPVELGRAEVLRTGNDEINDGMIAVCGAQLADAMTAAQQLEWKNIHVGVVNARFLKPLDSKTLLEPLRNGKFLVTVEEGMLAGGFGSAILEAAAAEHLDTRRLYRIGIPDEYVEHGERAELLAAFGLDARGIANYCQTAMSQMPTSKDD
ncbi:MAG: 1-deoxy-D-xylulose-5-phosphate synthase [Planctomycetaceae bacterium]|nr:1-deoxy-D-xylulose-5-phosphate synthase [Planctomycetaceae bacterium]